MGDEPRISFTAFVMSLATTAAVHFGEGVAPRADVVVSLEGRFEGSARLVAAGPPYWAARWQAHCGHPFPGCSRQKRGRTKSSTRS